MTFTNAPQALEARKRATVLPIEDVAYEMVRRIEQRAPVDPFS